jgi:hypothetical protein
MLAEVEFHTGLDDPLAHALPLLRKAFARAPGCAWPRPGLIGAQHHLWSFEAEEFLPMRARSGRPGMARSPLAG